MNPDRRRARPGYTHDPFDCCGKAAGVYGRPKGQVCRDCRSLIMEGQAARDLVPQGLDVFTWTETNYGWPCFYGTGATFSTGASGGGFQDRLRNAFWNLVNLVGQKAPANTPHDSPKMDPGSQAYNLPWPTVLSDKGFRSDAWSFRILILLRPDVQAALDELHQVIKGSLGDVYAEGRRRGGNALLELASGDRSLADFETFVHGKDKKK